MHGGDEQARTSSKCSRPRRRSVVEQQRRARHDLAARRVFGVEGAQRVEVDPLADLCAQPLLVRAQVRLQLARGRRRASRACPASRGAGARLGTPSSPSSAASSSDRLGVDRRVGDPSPHPDLPELALATGLRLLVAEEARQVPELHRLRQLCMPCSRYARQTGAVPSGRSVSERPPASSKVYISFWTMSVDRRRRARTARSPRTSASRCAGSRGPRILRAASSTPAARRRGRAARRTCRGRLGLLARVRERATNPFLQALAER